MAENSDNGYVYVTDQGEFTTLEDMELFHQAAKYGNLQNIQKLCEKDGFLHVNSRIQDDTQKTPLHRAAESGKKINPKTQWARKLKRNLGKNS